MKIKFVNHASFIISHKKVNLICDPWLEGTAFDNGWGLLAKTQFPYEEFEHITHIWFSHEHPDHFSPPNLNKIPEAYRKKITVLFQETADRKVSEYCRKVGFGHIVELKSNTPYTIEEDFKILCNPYTDGDSYALFITDDGKILNLNDCIVNTLQAAEGIANITGEVDVLFTQFGYANKVGNKDDVEKRKAASDEKLQRIRFQDTAIKPKVIVPFASFIYFCHEENAYMNNGVHRIGKIYDFISQELHKPCVVLYPGDEWIVGDKHDSLASIQKYNNDYEALGNVQLLKTQTVELAELKKRGLEFIDKLISNNPRFRRDIQSMYAHVYITDYAQAFILSGRNGLNEIEMPPDDCDIALSAESLLYCFKFLWGLDTLNINARFQIPPNGDYSRIRRFGKIAAHINRGEPYAYVFDSFFDKVRFKIKHELNKLFA
ncbi:MAG: MBL fold metallo-hydrolase [Flavobacteriales bacterium]|nr:MBL fold metallo-hydrolase [Flavobacteriales bacterium]